MNWMPNYIIENLKTEFDQIDQQFDLIKLIDHTILKSNNSIVTIMQEICLKLSKLTNAVFCDLFIISNNNFLSMNLCREEIVINDYISIKDFDNKEIITKIIDTSTNNYKECRCIPIFYKNKLFGVIFIVDQKNKSAEINSNLSNSRINLFAKMVSDQLSILVENYFRKIERQTKDKIISIFFNNNLKPSICWQKIVYEVSSFLPNFHPLTITPPPKVQLLLYNEKDKYLTIKASQGDEPKDTFILVDSSICGMLIKDRSKSWILVNPHDYKDLYKGFLIENEIIPQSELAVSIKSSDQIVGIINVEHDEKNVFTEYHINSLISVANFLSPFIVALKDRFDRQRSKEINLLYVMTKLLNRMGSQYQHLLGHPIFKSRLTLEKIDKNKNNDKLLSKNIKDLYKYIDDISDASDQFCQNLPEFLSYGPQDISVIINDAKRKFQIKELFEKENISIIYNEQKNLFKVFASKLLLEHVYNLIHNSLHAVREAIANNKTKKGLINISVEVKAVLDKLNKPTESSHLYVKIEDNGTGVEKEIEKFIGKPGYTTKSNYGSGFGLSAAKDYVESIGGELSFTNNPGNGFIVTFYLQRYNPIIHSKGIFPQ